MKPFAELSDLIILWRPLKCEEQMRAAELLKIISSTLRIEAQKVGKDLDKMIQDKPALADVAKSVTVDVVARTLMTSTDQEPLTQFAQSAGGYSVSGSYLVPGGGIYIKKSELARLGLRRQRYGVMDIYATQRNPNNSV